MKKRYLLLLTFGLMQLLPASNLLAQQCTQLSLPENAIARLCMQNHEDIVDLVLKVLTK